MAHKRIKDGLFITFEGVEGCGKTSQINKTYDALTKLGYRVLMTREPGGTVVGEKVRNIILDAKHKEISPLTELFLFETARTRIIDEVIRPALKAGKVVLCDRFNDSTFVYQGYAGKLELSEIKKVDSIATGGLKPDLTIVLDLCEKQGLERASKRSGKDRMEQKSKNFHKKVRQGFLDLAKKNKSRMKVVKVVDGIEETFLQIWDLVKMKLELKVKK
jgi:dTMP kinase